VITYPSLDPRDWGTVGKGDLWPRGWREILRTTFLIPQIPGPGRWDRGKLTGDKWNIRDGGQTAGRTAQ
jgi:hypothetical protein